MNRRISRVGQRSCADDIADLAGTRGETLSNLKICEVAELTDALQTPHQVTSRPRCSNARTDHDSGVSLNDDNMLEWSTGLA